MGKRADRAAAKAADKEGVIPCAPTIEEVSSVSPLLIDELAAKEYVFISSGIKTVDCRKNIQQPTFDPNPDVRYPGGANVIHDPNPDVRIIK